MKEIVDTMHAVLLGISGLNGVDSVDEKKFARPVSLIAGCLFNDPRNTVGIGQFGDMHEQISYCDYWLRRHGRKSCRGGGVGDEL